MTRGGKSTTTGKQTNDMGFYTGSYNDRAYTEKQAERLAQQQVKLCSRFPLADHKELQENDWFKGFFSPERISDGLDLFEQLKGGWRFRDGFSAFPTPSVSEYKTCKDGEGVSTWDDRGWWRCLFPSREQGPLTQSDVQGDVEHKHGMFFKDFNSLMDWKLEVRRLVALKKEEARAKNEVQTVGKIYDDYHKDLSYPMTTTISSSTSVRTKSLENGDLEEITETTETFADGSKEHKKFRKVTPRDGEPLVEDLSDSGKGWLWK